MAKIEIKDLPEGLKLSEKEIKSIRGGISYPTLNIYGGSISRLKRDAGIIPRLPGLLPVGWKRL